MIDEQGRTEPPLDAGELATLNGFLDFQRQTFEWKCTGVGEAGLRATVGVSPMTLGGLLKHLSYVEDYWFGYRLHGHERQLPWNTVEWAADPDWDWNSAAADTPEELLRLWRESVSRSRELLAQVPDLGHRAARPWPDGRTPNLRWILCHLIEEYARHNGHADLIRESVDGLTGE